ncbi:MAG: hypothetical protein LBN39_12585 [Planctomycetaceae bacterium]|jgi:ribonuclease HII|nr:hypothetical protein [Planctomycetaceae bacterium]
MYLIGTDEAGYGPNLGPLVISASVWETETEDLSALQTELTANNIRIGDSKKLYHGSGTLAALETGVLTVLQTLADLPKNLSELRRTAADTDASDVPEQTPIPIPQAVSQETVRQKSKILTAILNKHRVKLTALRSKIITADIFNKKVDTYPAAGAKASLLSDTTLQLVKAVLPPSIGGVKCLCDKHGGRNRYFDLLTEHFPGDFFQIIEEKRERSVYRSKDKEFRFIAKGESQLPIGLSSMLSKYVRELAMLEFNAYWRQLIPGLKPTAGYPEDAKRFRADVETAPGAFDKERYWRKR